MRVRWQTAAAVILILLGLGGLVWFLRGGAPAGSSGSPAGASPPSAIPSPARTPAPGGAPLPPVSVEESRITGGDAAGRLQWDLRAATLETDVARQEVRLRRVEGTFYERGALVLTLAAPDAVFSTKTQDMTLSGGVRARAAGDRLLEAERVQWLAGRHLLVATGNVRLTQARITVRADRLESDVALRTTKLSGNIRVTVRE